MAAVYRIRRHEADIVPVMRVARAGIAETCKDKHRVIPARRALLLLLLSAQPRPLPPAPPSRLPAAASVGSGFIADEPAMVATVKSRSAITGRTPSGSFTAEMWIELPMSVPSRSTVTNSGIAFARQWNSISWRTMFKHAAALDAGRLVLVDEVHGHLDVDLGVLADPQEIDMDGEVADRIELVVLRQDLDLVAVDVDRGERGQEPAAVDLVVDVLVGQGDRQGRLLVAVDDCRDFAVAPNFPGGPLTDPFARLGLELVCLLLMAFPFAFFGASAAGLWSLPKTSKAAGWAAFLRVASKGVYAGGGSIAERPCRCKVLPRIARTMHPRVAEARESRRTPCRFLACPAMLHATAGAASRLLDAKTPTIEAARRRDAVARWRGAIGELG